MIVSFWPLICDRIAPKPVVAASTVNMYWPLDLEKPITGCSLRAVLSWSKLRIASVGSSPAFQPASFLVIAISGCAIRLKFGIILLK